MPQLIRSMMFAGAFGFLFALTGILKANRMSLKTIQVPHKFLQNDQVSYLIMLKLQKEIGHMKVFEDIVTCFDAIIEKVITKSENIPHKKLQQNILSKLQSVHIHNDTRQDIVRILQSLMKYVDKL